MARLYGQVNLLTATAYDDAGEMVDFGRPSGVAFFAVGAPVGAHGDWSARAAMNSGDVTSWTMAGDYVSRAPARSSITLGMTYSLQALSRRQLRGAAGRARWPPQGRRRSRPRTSSTWRRGGRIGYGARYEHYDYLRGYGQLSPTARLTFSPSRRLHVHAKASLQQVAPGAEEFVPPADAHVGAAAAHVRAARRQPLRRPSACSRYEVGAAREFSAVTVVGARVPAGRATNQLVTVFGAADPARLIAAGGHYGVASAGDAVDAGLGRRRRARPRRRTCAAASTTRSSRPSGRRRPAPTARALRTFAPQALRAAARAAARRLRVARRRGAADRDPLRVALPVNSGFAGDSGRPPDRQRPLRHAAASGPAVHGRHRATGRCCSACAACSVRRSTTARSTTSCSSCARRSG